MRLRGVWLLTAVLAMVGAMFGAMAPAAHAGTCGPGGDPAQYYCATGSSSFDGSWTYVAATINESSSPDGSGPGQSVPYNVAVIYQDQGTGWVLVSAQICPDTVSCTAFFSAQGSVPAGQFLWVVFAATGPDQLIAGSYQYGIL